MGIAWMDSPVGVVRIEASAEGVSCVSFESGMGEDNAGAGGAAWSHCERAREELIAYFAGDLRRFTVPVAAEGTAFQRRVWAELMRIGFGETLSYGALARRLGDINGTRAVGLANGRNPVAVIVPCHRVIGADGSLTGYGGGLERKRWLLEHEGAGLFARGGVGRGREKAPRGCGALGSDWDVAGGVSGPGS